MVSLRNKRNKLRHIPLARVISSFIPHAKIPLIFSGLRKTVPAKEINSTRGLLQVLSPGTYPAPISKHALEVLEGLRMDLRALVLVVVFGLKPPFKFTAPLYGFAFSSGPPGIHLQLRAAPPSVS